jgi:hypothetical protein
LSNRATDFRSGVGRGALGAQHGGPDVASHVSTDRVGGAAGRIGRFGVIASSEEGGTQDFKVSDLPIDVDQSRRKQLVHVVAGCLAGVADIDHLADLRQAQAGGPAAADEVQP